tara:strand:- start:1105 stop:1296 length:192 start_codon:yes stop_codon:yes gene_type:complete
MSIKEILINSIAIGVTTSSTVLLGAMTIGVTNNSDWRDVVGWGIIGLAISSKYVCKNKNLYWC